MLRTPHERKQAALLAMQRALEFLKREGVVLSVRCPLTIKDPLVLTVRNLIFTCKEESHEDGL